MALPKVLMALRAVLLYAGLVGCAADLSDLGDIDPQEALAAGINAARDDNDLQAVALLDRALESEQLSNDDRAAGYLWRGHAFNDLGDPDRALDDLDAALALDDDNADAYAQRGRALLALHDYEEAVFNFDSALAIEPTHAQARNNRGIAFLRSGNDAAALADFTASLRLNPRDAGSYRNRGFAWLRVRNYRHAVDDFSSAIGIDPNDDVGYFFRGFARYFAGDMPGAASDLGFAASQPGKGNVYDVLAYYLILARSAGPDEAQSRLRRMAEEIDLSTWPGPLVALYIGDASPDDVVAAAGAGSANDIARHRTEAHFHLGHYYLLRAEREAAAAAFEEATALGQISHIGHVASLVELARLRATLQ